MQKQAALAFLVAYFGEQHQIPSLSITDILPGLASADEQAADKFKCYKKCEKPGLTGDDLLTCQYFHATGQCSKSPPSQLCSHH